LTDADLFRVQAQVRSRVLRWLVRHDYLDEAVASDMLAWGHGGGFSLDGSVRLAAWDRGGLEGLARYCARPSFSAGRFEPLNAELVLYHLRKPLADGTSCVRLSPLELLARLAALIPPPRQHRLRYYGVLLFTEPGGSTDLPGGPAGGPWSLRVWPNPPRGSCSLALEGLSAGASSGRTRIFDLSGRLVRDLGPGDAWLWDGRNTRGREVCSGIYFARTDVRGRGSRTSKVLMLR